MNRRRRPAGFTLMEVLVVIALMGIVTTLGFNVFLKMTDAWQSTRTRTALDRTAAQAFNAIREDLSHVVSPSLVGLALSGVDGTTRDDTRFFGIDLGDDSLALSTLAPMGAEGVERAVVVKYYVRRGSGQETLVRAIGSQETEVAEGVVSLEFEYAAPDGLWQSEWNSDKLPKAVRVSMTLLNPDMAVQMGEQIVRKAIIPIYVS